MTSFCERISMTALSLVLVRRGELNGLGAFELDFGLGVLKVEAGADLFDGLVDGVLYFLKIYFADDVEAAVGCHDVLYGLDACYGRCLLAHIWLKNARYGAPVTPLRGRGAESWQWFGWQGLRW